VGGTHLPDLPLAQRVPYGLDLLAHGFAWEAHEVWEEAWHHLPPSQARDALQGCIQAAATLLLRDLGRELAMQTQAARARTRLVRAAAAGVDVQGLDVRRFLAAWEDGLQAGGWPWLEDVWRSA